MNKIYKHYKKIILIASCLVTFLFLIINHFGLQLYGDAYGYDMMADKFIDEGLGNFHMQLESGSELKTLFALRGYAWPFLIAVFKMIGFHTQVGYTLCWAIFVSTGLVYFLPEIIETVVKKEIGIIGRISTLLMSIIFFPGLLTYPLSDVPALILIITSLYLYYVTKNRRLIVKLLTFIFIGFLCGMSYYIRQGSLVSVLGILFLVFITADRRWLKKILLTGGMLIGILFSAVPQIIINVECNDKMTYEVPISFTTGISQMEYYNGIKDIRYETNVSGTYPDIIVVAEDGIADALFQQEGIAVEKVGPLSLLEIILKYPVEALGIYTAKFVNNVDPRYGEIYITTWHRNRVLIMLFNLFLWFCGGVGIVYQVNSYKADERMGLKKEIKFLIENKEIIFLSIIILIPGLFHLAGTHVEPRYFYPVYVVLWMYVFMLFPVKMMLIYLKEHFISLTFLFVGFVATISCILNFTFEQIPFFRYFYQDQPEVYTDANGLTASLETAVGVINYFEFNEEEQKLIMVGNCEWSGNVDSKVKRSLVFAKADTQYVYKLPDKNVSDININMYLFDLMPGDYHIFIILDNSEVIQVYDTLYNVHK